MENELFATWVSGTHILARNRNWYLSAETSLSLSNSFKNKQEPQKLERGKIGERIGEDEGEEGGKHQQQLMDTLHPQPLHGKLKKNHLHFLGNPLIHLFGMMQEEVHMEPIQVWKRNVWVKKAWILNLLVWKL